MPIRQILTQLQNLFRKISVGKRIAIIILAAGSILGFVFLSNWATRPEFHPLYSNLDSHDAGIILNRLKEQKIPYRISANGSTILIPQEHIYETRMNLASEGLPVGGSIGFEVFDNAKFGMSEFAQNVNYQRALQGELARTINGFAEIDSSRVHIVMPENSLFVKDDQSASASVVLKLRHGQWLAQEQVQGIVHLVSSSISRLDPENVTVVDSSGRLLAGRQDDSDLATPSSDQLDYQAKVERKLENRVLTMLEKALGANKAIVRVSCALDFKRHELTEERFFPENQVVRSEQMFNETAKKADLIPQGIPGIQSNVPENPPDVNKVDDENTTFKKQDRTVNYEIGKLTSHTLEPIGAMQRLSVAVLVDGSYQATPQQGGEATWAYVPRSSDELVKIENLVKSAVNFDAQRGDKVEVVNIPFETTKITEDAGESKIEGWLAHLKNYKSYFKYAFLSLFLFLSFIFVVKPLIKWLTAHTTDDSELLYQLPKTVGEIENQNSEGQKQLTFADEASRVITNDNETSKKADLIPQGIPGIQSNVPENNPPDVNKVDDENTTLKKQDRTVNYEIGKLTSHTLEPIGDMQRLSVAVLVDGSYQATPQQGSEPTWTYVPRSSDELVKIENLVKSAVNFDAQRGDKVEVVNIPFETTKIAEDTGESRIEGWLAYLKNYKPYLKYAFLSLFLFLSFIFVVKPLIKWLTAHTADDSELLYQLPKTVGEIENQNSEGQKQLTFADQASRVISNDNETSVGVMRDWLSEG